jgi:NAD(P)-dependent dehydrogenase (short-subunit alcohol dehydrogenase family)
MNNVAVSGPGMVTEVEEKFWTTVLDTNLKSMVFISKYAVPEMIKNGSGSIINVSSVDGIRAGQTKNIPYTASKGGVISITRAMAVHHGRQNIRVNCIAPGLLHAPFSLNNSDKFRELRRKASPLGIEGVAEDIAWASVYLASDEARWVSGVVLPVDGGLLAASPISVVDNIIS